LSRRNGRTGNRTRLKINSISVHTDREAPDIRYRLGAANMGWYRQGGACKSAPSAQAISTGVTWPPALLSSHFAGQRASRAVRPTRSLCSTRFALHTVEEMRSHMRLGAQPRGRKTKRVFEAPDKDAWHRRAERTWDPISTALPQVGGIRAKSSPNLLAPCRFSLSLYLAMTEWSFEAINEGPPANLISP
jgi:hypothetical protein